MLTSKPRSQSANAKTVMPLSHSLLVQVDQFRAIEIIRVKSEMGAFVSCLELTFGLGTSVVQRLINVVQVQV